MSHVTRRALSTLIPPKVANPQAMTATTSGKFTKVLTGVYAKLPVGSPAKVEPKGILGRYQAKHFGDKPTGKPIIHFIAFVMAVGYAQNYYFHLRFHKNNAH